MVEQTQVLFNWSILFVRSILYNKTTCLAFAVNAVHACITVGRIFSTWSDIAFRLSLIGILDFETLKSLQVFDDVRVVSLSGLRCEKLDVCLCAVCLLTVVCGEKTSRLSVSNLLHLIIKLQKTTTILVMNLQTDERDNHFNFCWLVAHKHCFCYLSHVRELTPLLVRRDNYC